jgi:hypothetical protein
MAGDMSKSDAQDAAEKAPIKTPGIDRNLLEFLGCPVTRGSLRYDAAAQELISDTAGLAYPIRDGIPIMLPEEAREIKAK